MGGNKQQKKSTLTFLLVEICVFGSWRWKRAAGIYKRACMLFGFTLLFFSLQWNKRGNGSNSFLMSAVQFRLGILIRKVCVKKKKLSERWKRITALAKALALFQSTCFHDFLKMKRIDLVSKFYFGCNRLIIEKIVDYFKKVKGVILNLCLSLVWLFDFGTCLCKVFGTLTIH